MVTDKLVAMRFPKDVAGEEYSGGERGAVRRKRAARGTGTPCSGRVRLNEAEYAAEAFVSRGAAHHDLPFGDARPHGRRGACPGRCGAGLHGHHGRGGGGRGGHGALQGGAGADGDAGRAVADAGVRFHGVGGHGPGLFQKAAIRAESRGAQ